MVVGVVPYVPSDALALLARDTLVHESTLAYDGGVDGTAVLRAVITQSPRWLRPGGALLLELGADQAELLGPALEELGYSNVAVMTDEDGDVRGIEATLAR